MTLNERLAVWAGWEYDPSEFSDMECWLSPDDKWKFLPPAYDTDRNLIAEELLTKLTQDQWSHLRIKFLVRFMQPEQRDKNLVQFSLTLPPAELAAMIAEVVGV